MEATLVHFLKNELAKRVSKNSRYSMRSYAKSLGLSIGAISGILSGSRPLTAKGAEKICDKLGLSPAKKSEYIYDLVSKMNGRNGLDKPEYNRLEIDEETFRIISDWYHWAIMQLVRTRRYLSNPSHSQPKWVAKQLGISLLEAKLALERLQKLGFLRLEKTGFYSRTSKSFTTSNKSVTNEAFKKWQMQVREKALVSLRDDPIEVRSMTSMTMAIDPEKLEQAKLKIDRFQEELADFLESDGRYEVYQLCVSLFPLQIKEDETNV